MSKDPEGLTSEEAETAMQVATAPVSYARILKTFATLSGDELSLRLWTLLLRRQSVVDDYQLWKESVSKTFDNVTSAVLCEKLGYRPVALDSGKQTAVRPALSSLGTSPTVDSPYVVPGGEDDMVLALHPNTFPYNVAKDVTHNVLWSDRRLQSDLIREQLALLYGETTFVWYENLPQKKSLPRVFHVHVFSKKDKDGDVAESKTTDE